MKKDKSKKFVPAELIDAENIHLATHFIATNFGTNEKTDIENLEEARKIVMTNSMGNRTVVYAYRFATWCDTYVIGQTPLVARNLEVYDVLYGKDKV